MKLCYCDETGTGEEPYAVLLGVIVDATRMHVTKGEWAGFLSDLSRKVGQDFDELHTRHFYPGTGLWRSLSGQQRTEVIDLFINWFCERKHHIVFSAVDKARHKIMCGEGKIPSDIDTVWRTMGFHVALAIQKNFQGQPKNKGNTIFVFDEEVKEETKFQKLIRKPPSWSESYYSKQKKSASLCQIVDAPYFANSKYVGMLQVADFLAHFVRRHIEINEGVIGPKYSGEAERVQGWFKKIRTRTIPYESMYPKKLRCVATELFWNLAPASIRNA